LLGTTALLFRPLSIRPGRVLLQDILVGASSPLSFINIDQSYTHLEIECLVDSTRAGFTNTGMRFWLNGDRSAVYHLYGRNNGAQSGGTFDVANVNDTWGYLGQMPAARTGTGTPGAIARAHFSWYSRIDNGYRSWFCESSSAVVEGPSGFRGGGIWYGAPTVGVTRIDIGDDAGGTVRQGSRGRLYGVKI
jgi:hypothetical protein